MNLRHILYYRGFFHDMALIKGQDSGVRPGRVGVVAIVEVARVYDCVETSCMLLLLLLKRGVTIIAIGDWTSKDLIHG